MKTINKNTKQGQRFFNAYNYSTISTITEAYQKPSCRKYNAFRQCFEQYLKENGRGLRITGYNCMFFSVAWMTDDGLRVETPSYSYLIA